MAKMRFNSALGMLLLAVWLILTGLSQVIGFHFNGMNVVQGVLAIAAGLLLIINR